MTLQIEAIAFDKDGVIFDSEIRYAEGLTLAAEAFGIELPEGLAQQFTGLSSDKVFIIMEQLLGDKADRFVYEYWLPAVEQLIEENGLNFVYGVESLIETLYNEGYPLALVTSDSMDNVLLDVNRVRPDLLNYFSVVITRDDVVNPKPDAEPYERAAALLGVDTKNLLVIEDSHHGAMAGVNANAPVLLLSSNQVAEKDALLVHAVIKSHGEVFQFLK